jgi:hypothetical protein
MFVLQMPGERAEIFIDYISGMRLLSRMHKELLQLNNKKENPLRDGQGIFIDISPKKT